MDFPPGTNKNHQENLFVEQIQKEILSICSMPEFLLENKGGIERAVNGQLVANIFDSVEHARVGMVATMDLFSKGKISTAKQLQILNAIKLALNDIQLLADNEEYTYEYV